MNTIRLFSCLFAMLFLLSCEEQKVDVDKFGTITGQVLEGEDYTPLSGVLLSTTPASTSILTDDEGRFEFPKIVEGDVALTARKKDYLSGSVSVAVYEDEATAVTFFLLKDEGDVGWVSIYDPVPGNGAVDQSVSLTLTWQVDQEYSSKELDYTVYYFESGSTIQNIAGENLSAKQVVLDELDYSTTYYWYVVAKFEGSAVANSPTWSFNTEDEPSK